MTLGRYAFYTAYYEIILSDIIIRFMGVPCSIGMGTGAFADEWYDIPCRSGWHNLFGTFCPPMAHCWPLRAFLV